MFLRYGSERTFGMSEDGSSGIEKNTLPYLWLGKTVLNTNYMFFDMLCDSHFNATLILFSQYMDGCRQDINRYFQLYGILRVYYSSFQ